jgi:hypothetical protein
MREWIKAGLLRLQCPPTLPAPVTVAIPQNLAVFCVCGVVNPAGFFAIRAGWCWVKRASAHGSRMSDWAGLLYRPRHLPTVTSLV